MFVLNVWARNIGARCRRVTGRLHQQQDILEQEVQRLSERANFSQLQVQALEESVELTADLVEHNVEQIRLMQYSYPALTVNGLYQAYPVTN